MIPHALMRLPVAGHPGLHLGLLKRHCSGVAAADALGHGGLFLLTGAVIHARRAALMPASKAVPAVSISHELQSCGGCVVMLTTWTRKRMARTRVVVNRSQRIGAERRMDLRLCFGWTKLIAPRDVQQQAFAAQLQRAIQCDVPVVIHTRDAEQATLDLLQAYPIPRSGQVHCFTGTPAMAEQLLAMGFYLGFTGIVSFPKADNVRAALRVVPLERLLIETDSPYLAPLPHRGRRNEPAFVRYVAEAIAHVKGVPVVDVLYHSTQNFYRLYGKAGMTWEPLSTNATERCQ